MSIFQKFGSKQSNRYFIASGQALLKPHKKIIAEIQSIVGLDNRFWKQLYLNTLVNLAEYVQELPASEAHHHSGRGGLLTHTLETCLDSLRIRRGKILPPNSDAETVTQLKDLWTYAIFTGAIGHDLGKPITDIEVGLKDKKNGGETPWSTFKGAMRINKNCSEYTIKYRRKRVYASHGRATAFYAHHIIPTVGLEWLASNQEVFFYWCNLLTGHEEESGIIGSVVHEADKRSVASNLAGDQVIGNSVAAATSRKPLHQRIITSLRYQIDEGLLPLNRDGAAGWIVDGKLWVVVKRALDQVRDHMTHEGQTGIPARNDRLMDELQQYSILLPCKDRAVWKARVFAPEWAKAHELTLLCIPVEKVWLAEDAVPGAFAGTVIPLDEAGSAEQPTDSTGVSTSQPESEYIDAVEQPERPSSRPPTIDFSSLVSSELPIQNNEEKSALPRSPDLISPDNTEPEKTPSPLFAVNDQTQVESRDAPALPASPSMGKDTPDNQTLGKAFLDWLRDGLHQRQFDVNGVRAKIHMTREGLLLVSPAIFKQFDQSKWSAVQKSFGRLKLQEKNASKGDNIHVYIAKGARKSSEIKGYLIADTGNVFPGIELPRVNHALSRKTGT